MTRIITYLLCLAALVSCKTSDKFSIHKRKYNKGFYIDKNSNTETGVAASKTLKHNTKQLKPNDKNWLENKEAFTVNIPEEKPALISTKKSIKPSFTEVQLKNITAEKSVAKPHSNPFNIQEFRKAKNEFSRRSFGDFIKGVLILMGVLIFLLGLALLGFGVYLLIYAANNPATTSATVSYGLSLIGYGVLIIGVCATIFKAAN